MNLLTLGPLLAKYPKLAGLTDMLGMRANQLTQRDIARVAAAFDVEVPFTEELVHAFLELLKGRDINSVADLIQSKESINDIVVFFTSGLSGLSEAKAMLTEQSEGEQLNQEPTGEMSGLFLT